MKLPARLITSRYNIPESCQCILHSWIYCLWSWKCHVLLLRTGKACHVYTKGWQPLAKYGHYYCKQFPFSNSKMSPDQANGSQKNWVSFNHTCHWTVHHMLAIVNSCQCILFCTAQTYLILGYPRMNLIRWPKLNSFGIKHLVALNLILLVKTLVKESVHEALYLKKYYPVCNNDYLTQLSNELN